MADLHIFHQRSLQLEPALFQRRVLDEQVELWWFRQPRQSLLCYCASVALTLGLGFGGVGLLSTTSSLSGEWRLAVGTALCLLSLVVLLKQLLSSAIQDMNCVRSRRRIEQLRSGGQVDPSLFLAVGAALSLCGTVLLCVGSVNRARDRTDMLLYGAWLVSAGTALVLTVLLYGLILFLKRNQRRSRIHRNQRVRSVQVFSVSTQDVSTSRTSLI